MSMAIGDNAQAALRKLVDRIERLEADKAALQEDIKTIYGEAKTSGFDVKTLRRLIRERKRDADDLREEEDMLDVYRRALGDYASSPLGEAALRSVGA